jgi:hypothetical protein
MTNCHARIVSIGQKAGAPRRMSSARHTSPTATPPTEIALRICGCVTM